MTIPRKDVQNSVNHSSLGTNSGHVFPSWAAKSSTWYVKAAWQLRNPLQGMHPPSPNISTNYKHTTNKCTGNVLLIIRLSFSPVSRFTAYTFERCPPHVKINMESPRRYLTGGKPHIHKPQLVLLSNGISILFGVAPHESAGAPMYVRFPWVHGSCVTFEYASLIGQCISHAFPMHFLVVYFMLIFWPQGRYPKKN